jgi:hypothetical protein
MKRLLSLVMESLIFILVGTAMLWGQATSALRGTITDPSGAVIPGSTVTLTSPETGFTRTTKSGPDGVYEFLLVPPGKYRLEVEAKGFRKYVQEGVELLVKLPATANVTLTVGAPTQTIEVVTAAPLLNTSDATIGVAFGENQVQQLPLEARQVAGLYALQPGVAFLGDRQDIDLNVDTRSGAVNGAHSDQSNITIDGLDANDQGEGYAFTSVLRMNPDAIAEFRVTTTNYNADQGRSSGAQVSLVTKSGTNQFHGSLYEYHRNTITSANDYFIKLAELGSGEKNQAPKLIRNIFGGSLGGPIKRDRAFFFVNFDGRRDAQEESVVRTVPTATLRQGMMRYPYCPDPDVNYDPTTGVCGVPEQTQILGPQDITNMDPLGLGPNQVVLDYFNSFPLPNDNAVGDGLNFSGYRFPGKVHRRFDTYIARLDYQLTENGNQSLFFRGNLQPYDFDSGVPLFPGQQSLQATEDFSKGFAVGYTNVLRPTLVNQFRYGWTRQSEAVLGDSNEPWIYFRNLNDDNYVTRTHRFTLPVNNFVDDLSWTKGTHSFSLGTNVRVIRNTRHSLQSSFSDGSTNASWTADAGIAGTGGYFDPGANGFPDVDPNFVNSYDFPLVALIGAVTEVDAQYNYDKQGNLLAQGAPIQRHFGLNEYEFYAQDAWRIRPNLTLTYGLRWEISPPPWETTGLQVVPNVNMGQWFNQRAANMLKGIGSNQDPLIQFDLGGPVNGKAGFYPTAKRDLAPRLALAYAPQPSSGLLRTLFGSGNKTTIRAGFGVVYDHFGMGLLNTFDQNGSFGLSTLLTNQSATQTLDCAPRLTSLHVIPTQGCGGTIFADAPPGGFPQTPPTSGAGSWAIAWGLDNSIKTPYSYMLDFSITRELARNTTLEVSYVGHLSHRLLAQEDLAMPLDWVDPETGIDYFSAAARLSSLANAGYTTADITDELVGRTAQFWTDLFGPASVDGYPIVDPPYGTTSAAQSAFDLWSDPVNGFLHNETTALAILDLDGYPAVPVTGYNTFYNAQYSSLYAWRSMANAAYHGLQVTLRRRMSQGVQFDFNYTWSKSIDLMSDAERVGTWGGLGGNIINSWAPGQMRAVSDFDTTHQINSNFIVELPFGHGRALARNAHGVVEALIGGWQTSGILRWTTGFPVNVFNGYYWATNWQLGGQAVVIDKAPATRTTKKNATVNMFSNPATAYGAFRFALPGESGSRNPIRGDGMFSWDMSLGKRWKMPYKESHSLQFRWEVFNVPNSTRFDVQSNPPELDQYTAFGNYTGLLTNPRIMQFALRYEF